MTKLPQSLEKEIIEAVEANPKIRGISNYADFVNADDGAKEVASKIALAVLEKAEKLAEALKFCNARANQAGVRVSSADKALAEWKAFRGEDEKPISI